jgi:hypothetical protein
LVEAPVTTLESYLTGDVVRDRADITLIETVLGETAATIAATFLDTHWPYEVIRGTAPKKGDLSQSTTAMMIRAIDLILGAAGADRKELSYTFELEKQLAEKLQEIRQIAVDALSAAIKQGGSVRTSSKTYGHNDPLTLSFLAEIFPAKDDADPISNFLKSRASTYANLDPGRLPNKFFDFERSAKRKR